MAWLQVWCYTVKPVTQDMLRILRSFNIFEAILGNSCGHDSLWASMANLGWFVRRLQDMLETCKIRTCLHCLQCSIWTARPERHPSHHTWCIMVCFLHLVPQLAWLAEKVRPESRWTQGCELFWFVCQLALAVLYRSRPQKACDSVLVWWHGLQHTSRVAGCPQSRKHGRCPSSACNDMIRQYADAFFARPCWSWMLFTKRCNRFMLILCGPSCFRFLREYYTCLKSEDVFVKMF